MGSPPQGYIASGASFPLVFPPSGSEIFQIYGGSAIAAKIAGGPTIRVPTSGNFLLNPVQAGDLYLAWDAELFGGAGSSSIVLGWSATQAQNHAANFKNGKWLIFNHILTAGLGMGAIYASHSSNGNTGAVTNAINYTPPLVAGRYRIQATVNVTAWTTPASFTVAIGYKDGSGNARTDTMAMDKDTGTLQAAGAINAVDRFYGYSTLIEVDASGTAITLSTTGTFTGSPVYNLAAILEQVA